MEQLATNTSFSSRTVDWGVYQIYWSVEGYKAGIQEQMELLGVQDTRNVSGRKPKYALFFRDLIRDFPKEAVQYNDSLGLETIVSLEPIVWGRNNKGNYLDEITRGNWDSYFRKWAQDAKVYGKTIWYRFGYEMNGNWFSWGEQPELFKKAWIHIHQLFALEGASNVKWLFAPNVLWDTKSAEEDIVPYYPGNEYVDMLGLDGYNFGDSHKEWHEWRSYEEVFELSIQAMDKIAKTSNPAKPLILSEIGCADDERKAQWLQYFLLNIGTDPRVSGFIYFNYDKRSEGEPNWRLDSDSTSLKIFQSWIHQ
jgi:beta-mannanase